MRGSLVAPARVVARRLSFLLQPAINSIVPNSKYKLTNNRPGGSSRSGALRVRRARRGARARTVIFIYEYYGIITDRVGAELSSYSHVLSVGELLSSARPGRCSGPILAS